MKYLIALAAVALSTVATFAIAGNAAPLGMELGVATLTQVKAEVGSRTRLDVKGINKYTEGTMLDGDGVGLGIDGLKGITFIFDKGDKLCGVLMTLPKHDFQRSLTMLSGKYRNIERRVPFVGDSYAKFRQGDSVIELDAPHLSFDMSLRYLSNQLVADFKQTSATEKAEKDRRQANQL